MLILSSRIGHAFSSDSSAEAESYKYKTMILLKSEPSSKDVAM